MAVGKGLHLKLADRGRFAQAPLADIFTSHGASSIAAQALASKIATDGGCKTTVRPSINLAHLRNDCAPLGVIIIEIPPRRT